MNTEQIADLYNAYRFALLVLGELVNDLTPEGNRAYRKQEREVRRLHDLLYYAECAAAASAVLSASQEHVKRLSVGGAVLRCTRRGASAVLSASQDA